METELRRIINAIRKYWWIPLLLGLVLAPVAWFAGKSTSSSYVASTQLMIIQPVNGQDSVMGDATEAQTYLLLVESGPVLDRVILEFGLDMTRFELASKIEARILPGTKIIEIQVRDDDPQVAADLTNSVARHVETQVSDLTMGQLQGNLDSLTLNLNVLQDRLVVLDARISELEDAENPDDTQVTTELASVRQERLELQQSITDIESTIRAINAELQTSVVPVVSIDSAQPPSEPESPPATIVAGLGFVLGVLIGGCIILFLTYRDHSVRDAEHLESISDIPTITSVARRRFGAVDSAGSVLAVANAKAALTRRGESSVVLVTGREGEVDNEAIASFARLATAAGIDSDLAFGILENVDAVNTLATSSSALLLVQKGKTDEADVSSSIRTLRDLGIEPVGTVLLLPR